ncbi:MAG: 2-oxoacid:ferredoxin oxidoreductase subunit beta, partial [Caulobacteraceae bacterium]
GAAVGHLQTHQSRGEIVTGLIYIDPDAEDLHHYLGTVEVPLNSLGDAELGPGSLALAALNASLR